MVEIVMFYVPKLTLKEVKAQISKEKLAQIRERKKPALFDIYFSACLISHKSLNNWTQVKLFQQK